jgi:hypothetical protein
VFWAIIAQNTQKLLPKIGCLDCANVLPFNITGKRTNALQLQAVYGLLKWMSGNKVDLEKIHAAGCMAR